jgi:hypothetical protein
MNKVIQISILLLAVILFNCGTKSEEGPDTTKPIVTVEEPVDNQQYAAGSALKLTATFTDNKELKECVVTLTFEGDATQSIELKGTTGVDDPWTPEPETIALTGKSMTVTGQALFESSIPASKTGKYTLTLEVKDNAEVNNITTQQIHIELI